jgi:putative DNA primase/helicase
MSLDIDPAVFGVPDDRASEPVAGVLADGHRPTDVGNADRLVAAADGCIRYVHAWSRWIVYRDGRWIIDTGDALITEIAKQVPRRMLDRAVTLDRDRRDELWKWATRSETSGAVASMVRLARGIDGVIVEHEYLDAAPFLLNVLNGTIDLRTGRLLDHDPEHLLTMQAPVIYAPDADASLWRACVQRWQPDSDQRAYLQRAVGSAITGHPIEHVFVNHGDGGNGKSKFFGAIAAVLGPYHVVPHESLLVVQRHEQHDTVKARLFRTRMAVGAETDRGARLDETKIKDLTGGDPVEARRMREDLWKFAPTWTLFLHTNHRPRVRDTSEGIWRRLRLIRWTVTIPKNEQDDHLADRLAGEASGILNWLIEGCLDWQQRGLDEPPSVALDTAGWRGDEDIIGRWLADCTIQGPAYSATAAQLRESHERWCKYNGENPLSAKALGVELERRNFDSAKVGKLNVRTWLGVGLLHDHED